MLCVWVWLCWCFPTFDRLWLYERLPIKMHFHPSWLKCGWAANRKRSTGYGTDENRIFCWPHTHGQCKDARKRPMKTQPLCNLSSSRVQYAVVHIVECAHQNDRCDAFYQTMSSVKIAIYLAFLDGACHREHGSCASLLLIPITALLCSALLSLSISGRCLWVEIIINITFTCEKVRFKEWKQSTKRFACKQTAALRKRSTKWKNEPKHTPLDGDSSTLRSLILSLSFSRSFARTLLTPMCDLIQCESWAIGVSHRRRCHRRRRRFFFFESSYHCRFCF